MAGLGGAHGKNELDEGEHDGNARQRFNVGLGVSRTAARRHSVDLVSMPSSCVKLILLKA
jgi:hypothetical protein